MTKPSTSLSDIEIQLSPKGVLHLLGDKNFSHAKWMRAFDAHWLEGWFSLAADKSAAGLSPSLRFWQSVARHALTALCHLPEETESPELAPLDPELLFEWTLKAPPMQGGEYLNTLLLAEMYRSLHQWICDRSSTFGNLGNFLKHYASDWQQVGRVCFHLAENKSNPDRPFAFLATYSTGFGATGNLKHLPLKNALVQHSQDNNRQALIKLLTPVQIASESCEWVKALLKSSEIYQPLSWSPSQAYRFLTSIPALEASGLSIKIPNWWQRRPRPKVTVKVGSQSKAQLNMAAMLDFQVDVALGDQPLTPEEIRLLRESPEGLVCIRGQWVEVDSDKLQQALDHWSSIQDQVREGEVSFIDGMRLLSGAPSSLLSEDLLEEQREWTQVVAGKALADLLRQIRDPSQLPTDKSLTQVQATLRPYQIEGVKWLSLLSGLGLGACLADDMGLGKTLQILSLLSLIKANHPSQTPSLLIVPASLLGNWKREAERFTPHLALHFVHPSHTKELDSPPAFAGIDLVVTTYAMLGRQEWFRESQWHLVILDEAQAIKNADTQQSRIARKLKAQAKIALTGTPIENRLSDLWSLFDFLNPGLLGPSKRFKEYIKGLNAGFGTFEALRKLVSPYILRRMKTDPKIISDLPEKIVTPAYCQLTPQQARDYQAVVKHLKEALDSAPPEQRRGIVLQTLLRLKQICNHPAQFNGQGDYTANHSGKFRRIEQICEELASRQEKVLIFTQFKEIIEPLADHLSTIFGRSGLILHGGTPVKEREKLVEAFQREDGPPFFVLSLKAGGTGLTLTAASHVIHFDRWWNPAVENQATDRAFRIGQKKNVQVHTFITQGTVEEQIDAMISSKQQLANEILMTEEEVKLTELSDSELIQLVSLDIDRAVIK